MEIRIIKKDGWYIPQSKYDGKNFSSVPRNADNAPYQFLVLALLYMKFPEWVGAEIISED